MVANANTTIQDTSGFDQFRLALEEAGITAEMAKRGAEHFCPGFTPNPPLNANELETLNAIVQAWGMPQLTRWQLFRRWASEWNQLNPREEKRLAIAIVIVSLFWAITFFVFSAPCPHIQPQQEISR